MSTEDQMSIEDRVRAATRAGAGLIRDVRPLGAPAPVRLRRRPGPAPRRWASWGVPLAAAAAVAAVALTLVVIRQPGTPSPVVSGSGAAAPATIPRYYAAPTYDPSTGKNGPLIVGDDLTGKVIATVTSPPGQVFTSVHGAPDNRTFVVQAVVNATPGGSPSYAWYLLRIAPGSAHPYQLTKLPIKLPGNGPPVLAYALSPDGRELAVESRPGIAGARNVVITLGLYSVSSGAELRAWTAPTKITSGLGGSTLTWLSGGRRLVFSTSEFTASSSSAYYSQLRTLDVTGTGTSLMADSQTLLTVSNSGASTCLSLQLTPDGKAAICATQYAFVTGGGSDAGCANGGLKFIAFPLHSGHSRVLYQYRGACHNGESFTLWTNASASSIIGVIRINPANEGGKEAVQIGVITGGRLRPLNIAKSVPPSAYAGLAF